MKTTPPTPSKILRILALLLLAFATNDRIIAKTDALEEALVGKKWLWHGKANQVLEFGANGKFNLAAWEEQGITAKWEATLLRLHHIAPVPVFAGGMGLHVGAAVYHNAGGIGVDTGEGAGLGGLKAGGLFEGAEGHAATHGSFGLAQPEIMTGLA